jgi:6-pyruvoyltetrahydropterin/6-carboxytetrahydropterin synthase
LYVSAEKLDKTGFVADFKVLDKILKDVTDILDHQNINELPSFKETNPTAENIAGFIFEESQKMINDSRVKVSKVSVWESEKSCATVEV